MIYLTQMAIFEVIVILAYLGFGTACGNLSHSQDLAQEIFIVAWRKLSDLKEPAKFKAWLYGIARNLIHNPFVNKPGIPWQQPNHWTKA
jgi:hypothetical protein